MKEYESTLTEFRTHGILLFDLETFSDIKQECQDRSSGDPRDPVGPRQSICHH